MKYLLWWLPTNFKFVGEEVLDYVAAKMGVIGDVTIGGLDEVAPAWG